MNDVVGPMPTPQREEPARFPGGADALDDEARYGEIPDGPIGVDLPPQLTPVTAGPESPVPDAITEPDDKPQEPSEKDEAAQESDEPETPV